MNGNPAQQEIVRNAREKIDQGESLTEVERIVLREYVTFQKAKLTELQLKSQHTMLNDLEYARMARCKHEIEKYDQERA